jgi:trimethylamine monooxygenase
LNIFDGIYCTPGQASIVRGSWRFLFQDLPNDEVLAPQRFSHVVVASGHYSVPHVPSFPGIERFPGRVMHAHDFRDACEFKGKRLLLVGSSYSAEDIAMQCLKYGAQHIICTWRTKPMGFHWPKEIEERPLLQKIEGNNVSFKDGSSAEVDVILLCTGYLHCYPFLPDELRLKSRNRMWPPNLYKGCLFLGGGNDKLFYVGAQDQYYTYTMFDQCALWTAKVIMGDIELPETEDMKKDAQKWLEEEEQNQDYHDEIKFQTRYVQDLCKENQTPHNLDVSELFNVWEGHKHEDILTYRDQSFASVFTGTQSPIHHTTFMKALDDSLETFMNQTPEKVKN